MSATAPDRLPLWRDPYRIWLWLQPPLWLLLLGLSGGAVARWIEQPLAQIEVSGALEQLDARALEQQLWRSSDNSYARADLQRLKGLLEDEPWVNAVELQRAWPERLLVRVREEQPVARWGSQGLVNEQGLIFSPGDLFAEQHRQQFEALPRLFGPQSRSLNLMAQYRNFSQLLRPLGVGLSGLEVEPRGAWHLQLDNGIRLVVGRGQEIDKLRRFSRVYGTVLERYSERIEQVDVRYTNGLAVRWNEPPKSAQAQSSK